MGKIEMGSVAEWVTAIALAGLCWLWLVDNSDHHTKKQDLIAKATAKADINRNGILEPEEIGIIYQTIGKPFYEGLTDKDMHNYLEKAE